MTMTVQLYNEQHRYYILCYYFSIPVPRSMVADLNGWLLRLVLLNRLQRSIAGSNKFRFSGMTSDSGRRLLSRLFCLDDEATGLSAWNRTLFGPSNDVDISTFRLIVKIETADGFNSSIAGKFVSRSFARGRKLPL